MEVAGFAASLLFKTDEDGGIKPRAVTQRIFRSDNPRLVAIALNISLGMFGMHRLYLGTDVKVPIFYTLTIGGGVVLWIADLVLLITADDLEPFIDNPHMFMWNDK
ncbi:MAG: TM2 domain-containing protein [Flavobacteriales bacterium]